MSARNGTEHEHVSAFVVIKTSVTSIIDWFGFAQFEYYVLRESVIVVSTDYQREGGGREGGNEGVGYANFTAWLDG